MTWTSRIFWRLRRLALHRLALHRLARRGRAQGQHVPAAIQRFALFQGTLHIAGALDAGGPVRSLALCLPGGETLPLRFGAEAPGRIGFDQTLAVPADPLELANAWLSATLGDGTEVTVHDLGRPHGDPAHEVAARFHAMLLERPPGQLLEVGARARSGVVRRNWVPVGWCYSGFDIEAGPNVDVVGDAHALSRSYESARFDAVMAFSVLEHLLMPWKFIIELNRVLKPGALGLFTTHQCWPLHDEPWDFWRFSDTAWAGLLNPATGFEIIAARMGEPAYIVAQKCAPETAFSAQAQGALASFVLFRKTGETALQWPVELGDITGTRYPT